MIEIVVCLICVLVWSLNRSKDVKDKPPMYKDFLPIIGHTHIFLGSTTHLWKVIENFSDECTRVGGVMQLQIGLQPYYVITDPKDALTIAKMSSNKHFVYDFCKRWLGSGLITSSGSIWKTHRKLLLPAFSSQVLSGFQDVINEQARKLIVQLDGKLGKGNFDISCYLKKMAIYNICLTTFGITSENNDFLLAYAKAIDVILELIVQRFTKPWLHSDFVYNLTSFKRKEDEVLKDLNGLADKIIKQRRAERNKKPYNNNYEETKAQGVKSKPLLDLLLDLSEGETLTDQEIREEIDTTLSAAFDTTAWLLTYILVLLGSNHHVQDRVYKEIEEVLGKTDRDVDKACLSKLVYMELVIKEALRLHTVIPITFRTLECDIQLREYKMKAGSHCIISAHGIHRHPCWGEDPERFNPDRWLEPEVQSNVFAGFSLGRRSCIGKTYAMMSLKSALCYILRRYKLTAIAEDLAFKLDFVLKPVAGHHVSIEKRS